MKIDRRDTGLLAIGFIGGAIITLLLMPLPPPPSSTASSGMTIDPVPAATLLSRQAVANSHIQRQATNLNIFLPPRFIDTFDTLDRSSPPPARSLHLIDTHYQPNIKLEDLE